MKNLLNPKKILIILIFLLVSFTTIFPFLWMLATSFKAHGEVFSLTPQFIPDNLFEPGMWDNYVAVLQDYNFIRFLLNSTLVAGLATLGQIFTCSLGGFAFARMKFPGKEFLFALVLATMMMPQENTIIPEFLLMLNLGWYNTYLPLIVPSALIGSFGVFLFRTFFEDFPTTLEDAAFIDGVNSLQMFYKVFLPNAKPAVATLGIIAFMNNWNELLRPVVYIDRMDLYTATMGLALFQGAYGAQWHLLLTAALISVFPVLVVYVALQKYFVKGMLSSGID